MKPSEVICIYFVLLMISSLNFLSAEENTCREEEFRCANRKCILRQLVCDGEDNCGDESDEGECRPRRVKVGLIDMNNFSVFNYSELLSLPDLPQINFFAFMRSDPSVMLDGETVIYVRQKQVVIFIHGYATTDLNAGIELKDALLYNTSDVDCVIVFDWRTYSLPIPEEDLRTENRVLFWWPENYEQVALKNIPFVARILKQFILERLRPYSKVHLIGYSLGGHLAGTAARLIKNEEFGFVGRISAIDPAGPIFDHNLAWPLPDYDVNRTLTLHASDAAFVDVIHASRFLGMISEAGHIDFYVQESEWSLPTNLHHKALHVYIASINSCSLISCPFDLLYENQDARLETKFTCNTTNPRDFSSMGYMANKYSARGKHVVKFYEPGNCSSFMNLPIPAKDRVCRKPPVGVRPNTSCKEMPFLQVCEVRCLKNKEKYITFTCTVEGMQMNSHKLGVNQSLTVGHELRWINNTSCDPFTSNNWSRWYTHLHYYYSQVIRRLRLWVSSLFG